MKMFLNPRNSILLAISFVSLATTVPISAQTIPPTVPSPTVLQSLTPHEIDSLFTPPGAGTKADFQALMNGTLSNLLPNGMVGVPCSGAAYEVPTVPTGGSLPTRQQAFLDEAARFDLIAVGRVGPFRSYILPNGAFLYSIMNFLVEDVIKNNPASPVEPGETITISREGGVTRVGTRVLRAACTDFPLFRAGGEYYLDFKYIPKAKRGCPEFR